LIYWTKCHTSQFVIVLRRRWTCVLEYTRDRVPQVPTECSRAKWPARFIVKISTTNRNIWWQILAKQYHISMSRLTHSRIHWSFQFLYVVFLVQVRKLFYSKLWSNWIKTENQLSRLGHHRVYSFVKQFHKKKHYSWQHVQDWQGWLSTYSGPSEEKNSC